MNAPTFLDRSSPRDELVRRGGGKATQLAAMDALGIPVPRWFCIPTEIMAQALPDAPARIDGDVDDRPTPTPESLPGTVPGVLAELICRELRARGMEGMSLAVRSSGIEEDGADRSFAGQFESVLHCEGEEAILAAVARCWASAFSDRIRTYRRALGDGTGPERPGEGLPPAAHAGFPRMGVVVQEMVEPEVAGVAFSRNPSRSCLLPGPGQKLVSRMPGGIAPLTPTSSCPQGLRQPSPDPETPRGPALSLIHI